MMLFHHQMQMEMPHLTLHQNDRLALCLPTPPQKRSESKEFIPENVISPTPHNFSCTILFHAQSKTLFEAP